MRSRSLKFAAGAMLMLIVVAGLTAFAEATAVKKPFTVLLAAYQAGSRPNELSAQEKAAGWISLFDGKTLNGWTTIGGVRWTVVDGALSADPESQPITPTGDSKQTWPQGFLRTTATFSDFEMTAEFWNEEDINSGLFIRCGTPTNPNGLGGCYEINISDPHATSPTGSIVGVHSSLPDRVKTAGKWSRLDVTADGPDRVVQVDG